MKIEAFGDVAITVNSISRPKEVLLRDVVYVPSFYTSVASLQRFIAQNVHWNTEENQLQYKGKTVCYTLMKHGQWVLEYNK